MALTDEGTGGMVMPVQPMGGYGYGGGYGVPMAYPMMGGYGGNGFGFGGDLSGLIVLFLFAAMFGFGGNGFGGFGGGVDGMFPWLVTGQAGINANTNAGFDNAAVGSQLSGIQSAITSGFGDVQTALCGGFAGVNAGVSNGFAQAEIANNARQIANLQQMFGLQSQFSDCCCENRLASADLKYTIATEACADRAAVTDALRDVIANQTAGTQRVLDQLCADKLEQKNDIINQLRSELMYARGQASQDVQTAAIQAGQRTLANEIEQYVLPTPRPAYLVQNPNCCPTNVGCGCGTF